MPETATTLSPEEIAARGDKLYHEKIEDQLDPALAGQVVAIDVLSGDFSVAANASLAVRDLRTRKPNAVTFGVRIGSRTFARIGRGPRKVK
ncbi:MAG: hypothetical protein NT013_19435 [Planctomycetia bacterium]|nr:hypothetical protein [Planctomycetia bacterium]